jgi:putative endonuclease
MGRAAVARGRWGEDQVARWYRARGYAVVDRNWRTTGGEIDLVVRRDQLVVFVEVKARRTDRYGTPAEAVGATKQQRLRRLAARWLADHRLGPVDVRIDVAAVTGVTIEVIEGIA